MSDVPAAAVIPAELQPQDHSLAVYSITTELWCSGFYAGTPSVVVRLQGCPVGCSYCNQPNGIPEPALVDDDQQATEEQLESGRCTDGFRWLSVTRLCALIGSYGVRHVVITGGEPALYDLAWFTEQLREQGNTVQVETSGTLPLSVHRDTWVTLSPKHDCQELTVWDWLYKRADEVLLPITGPDDSRWLDRALKAKKPGAIVWLQPIMRQPFQDPWLQDLCWQLARDHWVRVAMH
jgi:7-carboxy-7-deazaguanine synthase